jgi:hypothetical protein
MAAVQANPAMQQQQGMNNNMNNVIPAGMTKEAVQALWKVCHLLPVVNAFSMQHITYTYATEISTDASARRARERSRDGEGEDHSPGSAAAD